MAEAGFQTKKNNLNNQITLEMNLKNAAIAKVEQLEKQLQLYELSNQKSVDQNLSSIWKKKFEEMYNIS